MEGGRRDEPEGNQPQDAHDGGGHLVSAAAIADALPPVGRSRVGVKLRATLVAGIAAKLADGWQPDDIADELTRDLDTARTTGVYAHRLADMPTNPPRRRTPTAPQSGLKPPKCEDEGCNDKRQRHNADGIPYRCPKCHPLAVGRSQSAIKDRNPAAAIPRQDARLSTLLGAVAGSMRV